MVKKKKEKKLYKRMFLNKDSGVALAELDCYTETNSIRESRSLYAYLTLSDCNRQICLDFAVYNTKVYKKRLAKVRRLKKLLDKLEKFMLANPPIDGKPRRKVEMETKEVEGLGTFHIPVGLEDEEIKDS
jgi:hypothetical protein